MTVAASVHIANSFQKALDGLVGFLPNLLEVFLILIVGYFIARVVKGLLTAVLEKVGVDKALHSGPAGAYVDRVSPGASPAGLIAGVVFWFIFLFVLTAAISALKIPAVTAFMNQVLSYLPNVIAAVIIFVIAGVIAAAAGAAAAKLMGDTPTGRDRRDSGPVVGDGDRGVHGPQPAQDRSGDRADHLRRAARLSRAGRRAGVRAGRPRRCRQLLAQAYSNGRENKGQVKQDMQVGKDRVQDQAQTVKNKTQDDGGSTPAATRR